MTHARTQTRSKSRGISPLRVILTAALVCGFLDIAYVFLVFGWRDGRAARILQGIAVSVLGPTALSGGSATAIFGLAVHFGVATLAAGLFYALSRYVRSLVSHPWLWGAAFGVSFYLLMNLVLLRLTRLPAAPFPPPGWTWVLAAHVLCVGWPVAWVTSRLEGPREPSARRV